MIKKYLGRLLLTSAVILLPMLAGLILWNKLPETIPVHFGPDGTPDSFSGRWMAVFIMPLFMLAIHWVCTLATAADPKHNNVDGKPLGLVLWICPLTSLLVSGVIYTTALGVAIDIPMVMGLFFGCLFVVIGNFLPKCRQNYTIGIKLPWTLNDVDNWNKTHRFAGRLWIIGGLVMIVTAFFGNALAYAMLGIILVMVIIPTLYSYILYKKK